MYPFFPRLAARTANVAAVAGLLLAAITPGQAIAASLEGRLVDLYGQPLAKVPICLSRSDTQGDWVKQRSTDSKGNYRFNDVQAGADYEVAVYRDDSATGRKLERYRTYLWSPARQAISLVGAVEIRNAREIAQWIAGSMPA